MRKKQAIKNPDDGAVYVESSHTPNFFVAQNPPIQSFRMPHHHLQGLGAIAAHQENFTVAGIRDSLKLMSPHFLDQGMIQMDAPVEARDSKDGVQHVYIFRVSRSLYDRQVICDVRFGYDFTRIQKPTHIDRAFLEQLPEPQGVIWARSVDPQKAGVREQQATQHYLFHRYYQLELNPAAAVHIGRELLNDNYVIFGHKGNSQEHLFYHTRALGKARLLRNHSELRSEIPDAGDKLVGAVQYGYSDTTSFAVGGAITLDFRGMAEDYVLRIKPTPERLEIQNQGPSACPIHIIPVPNDKSTHT